MKSLFPTLAVTVLLALTGFFVAPSAGDTPSRAPEATPSRQIAVSFKDQKVGQLPTGFEAALTGAGEAPQWIIADDPVGPVLVQKSQERKDYRFPLCVYTGLTATDVDVSVRFKAISGSEDQAAGLVIRYQGKDDYYVVRANALEDNVRLYRVVSGSRHQFAGADTKVTANAWHTLRLRVQGQQFHVFFDGQPLFDAEDATFTQSGKVGLWTKADSVTAFSDLAIKVLDRP